MVTGRRSPFRLFILILALTVAIGLAALEAGCGSDDESSEGTSGGGGAALEVIGADGATSYTMEDLRDMSVTEGYWGMKSSTGRITPPVVTKGVLVEDLFGEVGGLPEDMAISLVAKDGYEMTVSVAQLKAGDFITYDMVTGDENDVEGPLKAIVAYEYDGKAFDPLSDGPLRLAVVSPEMNQVTDGHWSVKWLNKVQIKAVEREWILTLKGKLTEEMDRATFETGAAEGCHGTNWTDADGNVWTGIPLYLLVGRVDDDNVHEGPAYNRDMAEAGYQVRITSADGKSIEVSSDIMYYNKALIVAYRLNGEALPEDSWPLRLVGEGIDTAQMAGQITGIEALVPAE
ncbi:MAG: molybdopterin-dependent oxidoreductase [Thermoleophilia bacterium]|nr:molybdopterin-dependent oxidoreductase [Thermoleophilia bacterium]